MAWSKKLYLESPRARPVLQKSAIPLPNLAARSTPKGNFFSPLNKNFLRAKLLSKGNLGGEIKAFQKSETLDLKFPTSARVITMYAPKNVYNKEILKEDSFTAKLDLLRKIPNKEET